MRQERRRDRDRDAVRMHARRTGSDGDWGTLPSTALLAPSLAARPEEIARDGVPGLSLVHAYRASRTIAAGWPTRRHAGGPPDEHSCLGSRLEVSRAMRDQQLNRTSLKICSTPPGDVPPLGRAGRDEKIILQARK